MSLLYKQAFTSLTCALLIIVLWVLTSVRWDRTFPDPVTVSVKAQECSWCVRAPALPVLGQRAPFLSSPAAAEVCLQKQPCRHASICGARRVAVRKFSWRARFVCAVETSRSVPRCCGTGRCTNTGKVLSAAGWEAV